MRDPRLHQFTEKVMRINPGFAGTGAEAAIFGSSSINDNLVNDLRASTMAFAAECAKPEPDQAKLHDFAGRLEGTLRSMHVVGGISEAELDKLLAELHALTVRPPA